MNRTYFCLTLATLLVISTTAPAFAQLDTGTIVGTVRDQSSAVVPGATVTATQESTGTAVTTVTTDKGQFVFPTLKVGSYSIAAELLSPPSRMKLFHVARFPLTLNMPSSPRPVSPAGAATTPVVRNASSE